MTDNPEMFELLRGIVESIDPNQNNADWGREFGRTVFETDEEDLIVYVLSDAGEQYRSLALSKHRKRSRAAAYRIASSTNGDRLHAMAQQLEMPIVVPGFPPLPLSHTTHRFLADACEAAERHIKGALQNLKFWQRARDVSEPWPDEEIRSLIKRGAITPEQLAGNERNSA